ncbi:hypothetical protein [Sphingomonas sp.]|uniref:hypothetical protein n=1 Tax=Sphingomonas sp. TaxID=28214 RepID=UPI0035B3CE54
MRPALSLRLLPLATAALLSACIPATQPVSPPPPAPVAPTPPPPAPTVTLGPDWRDWPLTPGTWRYTRQADGSVANFGTGTPVLTLRCDTATRRITLVRSGAQAGTATIRTSSTTRPLPLQSGGAAVLAASDSLLDAMAFTRGRFVLEQPGTPPLVVPAYAEIGRVTQDCRG